MFEPLKFYCIYLFRLKRNYVGTFDVSCGMFSNVTISNFISLVLRDSDTDSENVSLIRRSVSDGQKHAVQRVYRSQVYNKRKKLVTDVCHQPIFVIFATASRLSLARYR